MKDGPVLISILKCVWELFLIIYLTTYYIHWVYVAGIDMSHLEDTKKDINMLVTYFCVAA